MIWVESSWDEPKREWKKKQKNDLEAFTFDGSEIDDNNTIYTVLNLIKKITKFSNSFVNCNCFVALNYIFNKSRFYLNRLINILNISRT